MALVAVAGCHHGRATPAASGPPSTAPTPTASTPSSSTPGPSAELATRAAAGARAHYRAVYAVHERRPSSHATWVVWRRPPSLRVDVVTKRARTTLLTTPRAAYACRAAGRHRTCFRVAKHGQRIPGPFRLQAQQLFSSQLRTLATHSGDYTAQLLPAAEGGAVRPDAACFRVRARPGVPKQRVPAGTYCLSSDGIVVAVRYPTGSTVLLRRVSRHPAPRALRPYAHPTPLPH